MPDLVDLFGIESPGLTASLPLADAGARAAELTDSIPHRVSWKKHRFVRSAVWAIGHKGGILLG